MVAQPMVTLFSMSLALTRPIPSAIRRAGVPTARMLTTGTSLAHRRAASATGPASSCRGLHASRCAAARASITADSAESADIDDVELKSDFLQTLKWRGFLQQATNIASLDEKLAEGPVVAYLGFDATASSLHVGSLLQIMLLRHFQRCGHKPIVLVGGGTTKVGDPSGKDASRQMLTNEKIQENIDGISQVFRKFLTFGDGPTDALMVNNDAWLSDIQYLDFLRE